MGDEDTRNKQAASLMAEVKRFARLAKLRAAFRYPAFYAPAIEITDFFADKPGTGAGTEVMTHLCRRADELEFNLLLKPESPRNKTFYGRFGFEDCRQHFGMMIRYCEPEMDADDREEHEAMRRKAGL